MTKEIAKMASVEYDSEKRAIVKKSVCPHDINESEFAYFIEYCVRTGLDPISKQIYCMKVGGKMQVMASIDGLRLIAERSGHYAGQRGPWWCGDDGKWTDVWLAKTPPAAAKVCVLRHDFTEPLCAVAKFDSYKRGNLWNTMPEQMIAKVAESLALRRAFPNELSGIYSSEEMEQAGAQSPTAEPMTDDVPPPVIRLTRAQKPVANENAPVEYKDAEYDESAPDEPKNDSDAFEDDNVLNPVEGGGERKRGGGLSKQPLAGFEPRKGENAMQRVYNYACANWLKFCDDMAVITNDPPPVNYTTAAQAVAWLKDHRECAVKFDEKFLQEGENNE